MKNKALLLIGAFLLCALSASAQLRVYQNGNVGVKSTQSTSSVPLTVGEKTYGSNYNVYMSAANPTVGEAYNIGLEGWAYRSTPSTTGRAIGIRGVAGNRTSGWNFGVLGALQGSNNGAAVFGSASEVLGRMTDGRYAGYFHGDLKATGASKLFVANPYDVNSMLNTDITSALTIISSLQTVQGTVAVPPEVVDTMRASGEEGGGRSAVTHYAFVPSSISSLYPSLVQQDAAGDTYVNNTELIPVLVAAVQQLYAMAGSAANTGLPDTGMATDGMDAAYAPAAAAQGTLGQNSPNPFTASTTVAYSLPAGTAGAWLCIFDMKGALLRQVALDTSSGSVTLSSGDLQPGMYLYSLIAGGREIATRRMIVSR